MNANKPFIHKTVRLDNRRPLSSSDLGHKILNDIFVHNFNEPFRNAVFATGDSNRARLYGVDYVIFPVGNMSYLWSPHITDLYTKLNPNFSEEQISMFLNAANYQQTDLSYAINSGNEIMIRCESYFGANNLRAELVNLQVTTYGPFNVFYKELTELYKDNP